MTALEAARLFFDLCLLCAFVAALALWLFLFAQGPTGGPDDWIL